MTDPATRRWTVVLTAIGSVMAALDTLVVAVRAEHDPRSTSAPSVEQLEWTVNAYNLSFAVLLITGAALGDRLGRRRMYAAGLVLFAVASAACALAPSVGVLIAARAIQGAGAALVLPLGFALLERRVPAGASAASRSACSARSPGSPSRSGRWSAAPWSRGSTGSGSSGSTCRSGSPPRRWCCAKLRESHGSDTGLDLRGLALISAGALGDRLGPGARRTRPGGGALEVARLASSAASRWSRAFVAWERRAPEPMLPMRLFRNRGFAAGNGGGLLHDRLAVQLRVPVRAVPADRRSATARWRPACG